MAWVTSPLRDKTNVGMSWDSEVKPGVITWNGDSKLGQSTDFNWNSGEANVDEAVQGVHDLGINEENGPRGGDDGCRNCGQSGHFARECTEERKLTGECFNCGQVGHNKADCPNPKVERPFTGECFNCGETGHSKADCPNPKVERPFTGICHFCQEEGHRSAECTKKPAEKCRNCLQEGHKAAECSAKRVIDRSDVPDMEKEKAWNLMKTAVEERETVDFQEALKMYLKGDEDVTYSKLENMFRSSGLGIYLIALDKEIPKTMINVDLQGKVGCKYTVGYFYTPTASRKVMEQYWPSSPEENLERLKDAGEMMENTVPLCRNCNELGHTSKACTQDKIEAIEQAGIVCTNCSEVGHRLRDCTKPRAPAGGTCRNCNQPGHKASDCPEERSAANVECRRCNEMGHFAKDCPSGGANVDCRRCGEVGHFAKDCPSNAEGQDQGRMLCRNCGEEGHFQKDCPNPRKMICRNCDEEGHAARECPKPKDWSRVKCNNCGEMGHTIVRCKKPQGEPDQSAGGDGNMGAQVEVGSNENNNIWA